MRLRTIIVFFSPMVADARRTPIRDGLKWLNAHLGAVRDLDVAIEGLGATDKRPKAALYRRAWGDKRADSHSLLARALQSARYRRLTSSSSRGRRSRQSPWFAAVGSGISATCLSLPFRLAAVARAFSAVWRATP